MVTFLRRGVDWIQGKLDITAGETIRYLRGAKVIDGLIAWPGEEDIEYTVDGETTIAGKRKTWRIDADKLVLYGSKIVPERGDTIEWETDDETRVFEVISAGGESVHMPGDPYDKWIRVSTKLIAIKRPE